MYRRGISEKRLQKMRAEKLERLERFKASLREVVEGKTPWCRLDEDRHYNFAGGKCRPYYKYILRFEKPDSAEVYEDMLAQLTTGKGLVEVNDLEPSTGDRFVILTYNTWELI